MSNVFNFAAIVHYVRLFMNKLLPVKIDPEGLAVGYPRYVVIKANLVLSIAFN